MLVKPVKDAGVAARVGQLLTVPARLILGGTDTVPPNVVAIPLTTPQAAVLVMRK